MSRVYLIRRWIMTVAAFKSTKLPGRVAKAGIAGARFFLFKITGL